MNELDSIAEDVSQGVSSFFSGIGTSVSQAATDLGIADTPASTGWTGVGQQVNEVGDTVQQGTVSAVSSVLPSTGTLLTGSIILIVILVLVLLILGKFEGIGLGL